MLFSGLWGEASSNGATTSAQSIVIILIVPGVLHLRYPGLSEQHNQPLYLRGHEQSIPQGTILLCAEGLLPQCGYGADCQQRRTRVSQNFLWLKRNNGSRQSSVPISLFFCVWASSGPRMSTKFRARNHHTHSFLYLYIYSLYMIDFSQSIYL